MVNALVERIQNSEYSNQQFYFEVTFSTSTDSSIDVYKQHKSLTKKQAIKHTEWYSKQIGNLLLSGEVSTIFFTCRVVSKRYVKVGINEDQTYLPQHDIFEHNFKTNTYRIS